MDILKHTFIELVGRYVADATGERLWEEVRSCYSAGNRYYHTLMHLEQMLRVLNQVKDETDDWDAILFALYYHDMVYDPLSNRNEEESAVLAAARLNETGFPASRIQRCTGMIQATREHMLSTRNDTNYLIDADLSVLGQDGEHYRIYSDRVRQEYGMFPDPVYHEGRKKVIEHFLAMPAIYKTPYFADCFEVQARMNLMNEFIGLPAGAVPLNGISLRS